MFTCFRAKGSSTMIGRRGKTRWYTLNLWKLSFFLRDVEINHKTLLLVKMVPLREADGESDEGNTTWNLDNLYKLTIFIS